MDYRPTDFFVSSLTLKILVRKQITKNTLHQKVVQRICEKENCSMTIS